MIHLQCPICIITTLTFLGLQIMFPLVCINFREVRRRRACKSSRTNFCYVMHITILLGMSENQLLRSRQCGSCLPAAILQLEKHGTGTGRFFLFSVTYVLGNQGSGGEEVSNDDSFSKQANKNANSIRTIIKLCQPQYH